MNNLTAVALKRPYTFVVLAILIVLLGYRSIRGTPTDIFPTIKIPCIAVIWDYAGLMPDDVSGRIAYYYERKVTTTVEGIERLESQSYYGASIIKIYLQPGSDLAAAEAEIVAISQTIIKALPPDISPPSVMRLEASSVPVAILQITSDKVSPSELYIKTRERIRPELVVIPGVVLPQPYGGQLKQLLISLDPKRLLSRQLTAEDVHKALQKQNIVLPAGDEKIGVTDWLIQTNAQPLDVNEFNDLPIKKVGNAWVYLRDVADARLGGAPQTNSVMIEGKQSVALVVMKSGDASTVDVVEGIRKAIPKIERSLPPEAEIKVKLVNDASVFVKDSISDVLREMITAAALTGLVVLLFLGSWRATVIIATTIPLSILTALICMHWLGQSLNVMTLGGLALAVGTLVDAATVMIENIDTHLAAGKPIEPAIIDAADQILVPTLVATLCIMIVWLPLFSLSGVSGYLFTPMAEVVMFATLASFILSRTLVPTMAKYLLAGHGHAAGSHDHGALARFQQAFDAGFTNFRNGYRRVLESAIENRRSFVFALLAIAITSLGLFAINGRDFFTEIRSGTLQMHMRAPLGTRIEAANRISALVSKDIKRLLPNKVEGIISICGLPMGPHNLAFIPTPTIGTQDCDITISLKDDASPVWDYRRILRKELDARYPGTEFTFQPADLTAKILNFGTPSPIDVQIRGMDIYENYDFARKLQHKLKDIPGTADVVIQQTMRTPTLLVEGQRSFGLGVSLTEDNIANSVLLGTSGSQQVDQSYWLDHRAGLKYQLNVYTPQPWLSSVADLLTIPVSGGEGKTGESPQLLGNVATLRAVGTPGLVTHESIAPVFDIYVSPEGRDLGAVLKDVEKVCASMEHELPRSAGLSVLGQAETMRTAYAELIVGLLSSIILVYLLIVVNFQSWLDPFIIISALPGALAGIAWALFSTHTTISVPALTGAIMSVGTGTANSILVVAYAKERMEEHGDALRAAVEAGYARIRPVLMTAAAMIIGMLPMAIGNSQNAPLGRAVMGGLTVATLYTLLFVPCVYAILHGRRGRAAHSV